MTADHPTEEHNVEIDPNPEPAREPFDAHIMPLDDPDDARHLDPADPRRLHIERDRGRPFER